MKRPAVLGLALFAVLRELPARAQPAGKTYRVGILSGRTAASDRLDLGAFRRELSSLGYHEGKNLELVYRAVGGDYSRLPGVTAALVGSHVDAIVAQGTNQVIAAKRATTSVPIIIVEIADPVSLGLIASLARPGGNITGVTNLSAALVGKQLELLKELVPRLRRIVVLRNPDNLANSIALRTAHRAARTLGMAVVVSDVRSSAQIDAAVKTIPKLRADAALVLADGMMLAHAARIVQVAAELRLPAVYPQNSFSSAGGLIAYGVSTTAQWSQAATYVDRILKGAKPADLPVENPAIFELIVNLKTARSLGLTVPQSILLSANQVIK